MKLSLAGSLILSLCLISLSPLRGQEKLIELYNSGQFTGVIEEATGLITAGDSSAATFRVKALSEIQLGRTTDAIATLEIATKGNPDDSGLQRMLAGQYFEAGDYLRARKKYSALVKEDSTDISSWMKLADMASFRQQYSEAIDALNRVLALDTMNLGSLLKMGEILDRHSSPSALIYYQKAWYYYPDNQKAAYAYANELIQLKKSVEAIPVCDSMLARDSVNIKFLKLRGYARYKCGEPFPAIESFTRAAELKDSTVFTFKYMGICQYLVSDFKASISSLRTAVLKDSTDAEIRFFLGSSLATTREKEAAMYQLKRSLQLMQPDPSVVGRIYAEKGNIKRLQMEYEPALEYYTMAWEADTTNPMYLYFQASILDNSMHRSKEALAVYEQYVKELSSQEEENKNEQAISILSIVLDRIEMLKEELFFRDED